MNRARIVFFVDGAAFSIGHKLSFQDMAGHELLFIKQRLLACGPAYEIFRQGERVAEVSKKLFTFFHCKFTVDVPGPNAYEVRGDFLDLEYEIQRGDRTVATISKRWFSWTDTYGVEIDDNEDPLLILASTVVIAMVCHDKKD